MSLTVRFRILRVATASTVACGAFASRRSCAAQCESNSRTSPPPPLPPPRALLKTEIGTKSADALLAGFGLAAGCAVLGLLQPHVGVPLFAPPMMASGVIFFYGPEPPHPKGFLSGTLASSTVCLGTMALLSKRVTPVVAQGFSAGVLLVWYKATSAVFPPAAVLVGALTAASIGTANTFSLSSALHYLAFPWLTGHAFLYGCAYAMSGVRSQARVALTTRRLRALGGDDDEARLHNVFTHFDTSRDGFLDADELKVALRVALGVDLSREDCVLLIGSVDTDGTGTVDFGEFKAVCNGHGGVW